MKINTAIAVLNPLWHFSSKKFMKDLPFLLWIALSLLFEWMDKYTHVSCDL